MFLNNPSFSYIKSTIGFCKLKELTILVLLISFGAMMWEILARKLPWSWLQQSTVEQAVCEYEMTLPMLEVWPSYVQSIVEECLQYAAYRPTFNTIHEYLLTIKNKGEGLTSDVLDGAFPDWYEFQCGAIYNDVFRKRNIPVAAGISVTGACRPSEILVMLRRSSSGAQWNARRRSTSVKRGLKDILNVMQTQNSPRKKEIERFGYEIAERLAFVRGIHRHACKYERSRWAKEIVLTRALEGDIERIKREEAKAKESKIKGKQLSRRGRKYSLFDEEGFHRLQLTSKKYQKKDWSKILHGMEKLKNSMDGFKSQVFEEINKHEKKQMVDQNSFFDDGVRYEEVGVFKGTKGDIDRMSDSQSAEVKSKEWNLTKRQKLSPIPRLNNNEDLAVEAAPPKDDASAIYAQLDKGRQRDAGQWFRTPEKQKANNAEQMLDTGVESTKSQTQNMRVDMTTVDRETGSCDQETSKNSDSKIHGSSSHGSGYAISDFLQETDSFRKERLEMMALRSQSVSMESAISSHASLSSRPRARSSGKERRMSHTRAYSSAKSLTRKN